jgi:predicted NUDIX family NTP pyrophosphohydrolase
MAKTSAGLLLYRTLGERVQVFLVHLGGPFWSKKDLGAWSIPKGEYTPDEDPFAAAQREFTEETGCVASGKFIPLTPIKQPAGKIIHAWAVRGDCDPTAIRSNTFSIEWPPKSGRQREFPEVDRAGWFGLKEAREKIMKGQMGFLDELEEVLHNNAGIDDRTDGTVSETKPRERS